MENQWDEIRELARGAMARDKQTERAKRAPPHNDIPRSSNSYRNIPTEHSSQQPSKGETSPLCWYRDTCKFFKFKQWLSLGIRYWGCANYSSDYPDRRWDSGRYRQPSSDPLCGYRKWIDQGIHPHNQWRLDCKESDAKRDREKREECCNEDHRERIRRETRAHLEVCRRRECEARERGRERKREMVAKAKAADEEYNAELARNGKWP